MLLLTSKLILQLLLCSQNFLFTKTDCFASIASSSFCVSPSFLKNSHLHSFWTFPFFLLCHWFWTKISLALPKEEVRLMVKWLGISSWFYFSPFLSRYCVTYDIKGNSFKLLWAKKPGCISPSLITTFCESYSQLIRKRNLSPSTHLL